MSGPQDTYDKPKALVYLNLSCRNKHGDVKKLGKYGFALNDVQDTNGKDMSETKVAKLLLKLIAEKGHDEAVEHFMKSLVITIGIPNHESNDDDDEFDFG